MPEQQQATLLDLWPRRGLKLLTLQRTVHWPVLRPPAVAARQ